MYYQCNQFFGSILAGNRLLVTIALSAYVMQLHHVDGLTNLEVRNVVAKSNLQAGDVVPLIGSTGQVWGAALRSHEGSQKPIFISIGHRISLDTAVAVVRCCCLHRVPEPVRQADLRSRDQLRLRIP
jgi:hypothetical protein